jgi:DNA-binding response OmpR family regulator
MKPHILIVEDDPDLAGNIRYNLERTDSFSAQIAGTGEEAARILFSRESDPLAPEDLKRRVSLIALDINLPGMDGFELCRRVRAGEILNRTPIIMLTARVEEIDKVKGLETGADDYVTKPFSVRDLVARVRAALRRSSSTDQKADCCDDGLLRVDYENFSVKCREEDIKLTRKEIALIAILTRNQNRVVPRERLMDEVWGLNYYGEARTLDVHISGLRKKLGDCGNQIETVIGIGYRLRAPDRPRS